MKAVKEYVIFYLIDREDQSDRSACVGHKFMTKQTLSKIKKKKKKAD